MEGKKKYFALVILLFCLLTIFAFANPSEDEKEFNDGGSQVEEVDKNNKTEEKEEQKETTNEEVKNQTINNQVKDNSYENALAAVELAEASYKQDDVNKAKELVNKVTDTTKKSELEERLNEVEAGIEVMQLLEKLEEQVTESENKEDLNSAKDYRDEEEIAEKISALTNEKVKKELQNRLDKVSKLLDDDKAPVANIKNNEAFKENIEIEVEDEAGNDFKIYLTRNNGEEVEIENNSKTPGEGIYELRLVDEAFNEEKIRFVVDGTDPKFKNLSNGGHYDEFTVEVEDLSNVTITVSKDHEEAKEIENNTKFTEEGTYKITATDEAGNTTTYWVAIDNTKPTIERTNEEKYVETDQKVTVKDKFLTEVKVTTKDNTTTYTRENFVSEGRNENFTFEIEFKEEGTYTIVATDKKGLTEEETFIIDKTSPVINGFEKCKYYYNKSVKPELIEENIKSYTLNGKDYDGKEITEDGHYILTAEDQVGHKVTVKFAIDTTAPTVEGIEPGKYYKSVKPIIKDENLAYVTVDKLPFIPGQEIKLYGTHELVAVDKAGNKTTVKFTIDNIAPKILLLDRIEFIQGDILPIKPVIIEQNIETITVKLNGKEIEYKQGDQLTKSGLYEMTVTDKAGNIATATFTMDSEEPILLEPINGGVYKDVKVSMIDKNSEPSNIVLLKQTKTVGDKLGISLPIYEKVEYNYGETIEEEGSYIVIVADKAYNVSYAKFTVDRTAPTSNIEADKHYKEITPEVKDANLALVTLSKKEKIEAFGITIGYEYVPKNVYTADKAIEKIAEDGEYKINASDLAGNTYEVEFVVDTKAPVINVVNGAHYNKVTPEITDTNINTITLNGNTYVSGTEINEDGEYTIIATDKAGNKTEVTFVIDKNAVTITGVDNKKYNKPVTPVINSKEEIVSIKLNGEDYVEGTEIKEDGTYTLVVTDKYTNTAEVTFTIDTVKPEIKLDSEIAEEIGANKTEVVLDAITATLTDNTDGTKTIKPVITHDKITGELDNVIISTDYIGKYTLTYNGTDEAGNKADTVTKTINVYKADYVIVFEDEENRTTTYSKNTVTPKATLNDDNGIVESITDFTIEKDGEVVSEMKDAGIYTVTANTTYKNGTKEVTAKAIYTINKQEVTLTYTHHSLGNTFEYEYDGNTNPYKATLSDGTELKITYTNEKDEVVTNFAAITSLMKDSTTYKMNVEVNTNNYKLTNETTEALFTVKQAQLQVKFPTTLTKETTTADVKVVNGNEKDANELVNIKMYQIVKEEYKNIFGQTKYRDKEVEVNTVVESGRYKFKVVLNSKDAKLLGTQFGIGALLESDTYTITVE